MLSPSSYAPLVLGQTIFYPFSYCKTLIQLGHEPLPPEPAKSWLPISKRTHYYLPGVFPYMRHVRSVDGLMGMYRGYSYNIAEALTCFTVKSASMVSFKKTINSGQFKAQLEVPPATEDEGDSTIAVEIKTVIFESLEETGARLVSTIFSHPLRVVAIRAMAQFVGRECLYDCFASPLEMLKSDGIGGFFAGLAPRVLGEILTLWGTNMLAFALEKAGRSLELDMPEGDTGRHILRFFSGLVVGSLTYPFQVVSTVMVVNVPHLKAGSMPRMPHYDNWRQCWNDLSAKGELKRGASILLARRVPSYKVEMYMSDSEPEILKFALPKEQ